MKHLRLVLGLLLLLLVPPALAQEGPFDGRWGFDAESCAIEPGTSDMVPTVINQGIVDHYESSCEITGMDPIGDESGSAWRVIMTCSGEGETWAQNSIFALDRGTGDGPRQLVEIQMDSGAVIVRQGCD